MTFQLTLLFHLFLCKQIPGGVKFNILPSLHGLASRLLRPVLLQPSVTKVICRRRTMPVVLCADSHHHVGSCASLPSSFASILVSGMPSSGSQFTTTTLLMSLATSWGGSTSWLGPSASIRKSMKTGSGKGI